MEKLTNIQLKIILRSWNLKVTRNKKDLIERLENDLVENRIDSEESSSIYCLMYKGISVLLSRFNKIT